MVKKVEEIAEGAVVNKQDAGGAGDVIKKLKNPTIKKFLKV
jgi:hypothetical protein